MNVRTHFTLYQPWFLLTGLWLVWGCQSKPANIPRYDTAGVATQWAEMTLFVTRYTPNTPTYASRALGYIGLTMYESVVHSDSSRRSLAGQLNSLTDLPRPQADERYNWLLTLNAGQATIIRLLYNHTSDVNKAKIDSLEARLQHQYAETESGEVAARSIAYGRAVATRIFAWAKTDGGHRAYLRNFPAGKTYPETPGSWKPPILGQSFSRRPLHPTWGNNRPFVRQNQELPMPLMVPHSTAPASVYYRQFQDVYRQNVKLTLEQKKIALWWADDPGETFSPPGHSYNLARLTINKAKPTLLKAAETYARVGMAVADAFIRCWQCKYHYFSERPSTYVTEHIDPEWTPFWPDPPFPAFPSGHATQAAAAATVLTDLYGTQFAFVDDSHVGRPRDDYRDVDFTARTFPSFWATAEESAQSRFLGGIHTKADNETGLREGRSVGDNINHLRWHTAPASQHAHILAQKH